MILMHKDTPVAEVVFENKYPIAYKEIYNEEIPIGTKTVPYIAGKCNIG